MYYARGGRVAHFDSAEAIFPSALHFSGEGDLFPVSLHYEDEAQGFAEGGMADEANSVRKAGRYGDTEIVHMNKEELAELKRMWGEPTINPHTGQPEYFLKGLWKGIKKVVKPIAPILPLAAMLIPGVGPLAAAGIGALSGGVTGGVKGALVGGALGGLGGGISKAVQGVAGISNPVLSRALGSAVVGGLGSAALGKNPLTGALMGGAMGAAIGPGGIVNPNAASATNAAQPMGASAAQPDLSISADPFASNTSLLNAPAASPSQFSFTPPKLSAPSLFNAPAAPSSGFSFTPPALRAPTLGTSTLSVPTAAGIDTPVSLDVSTPEVAAGKPSYWNRNFMGIKGLPNKYGIPLSVAALTAAQALTKPKDEKAPTAEDFFGKDYGGMLAGGSGGSSLGVMPSVNRSMRQRPMDEYVRAGYMPQYQYFGNGFAEGGDVSERAPARHNFAVNGAGTGRSDDIPAMLSDGEYVMDAETVAMLGDGSNKAGAKKLDEFRIKIRKHKGKKLARGKISANAKKPELYMAGGRA